MKYKTSLARSFVEGEILLGFWGYMKKIVSFASSFFILKSLSVYQLGLYHLVLSGYDFVSGWVHGIFEGMVSNELTRFVGEGKISHAKKLFAEYTFFRIMTVAMIASLIAIFAPQLSRWYGPEIILWARLLSLYLFVQGIARLMKTLLSIHLKFKLVAVRPTIEKLIPTLIFFYLYLYSYVTITTILFAQLLGGISALLFILGPTLRVYKEWKDIPMAADSILLPLIVVYGKWDAYHSIFKDLFAQLRPVTIKYFVSTEAVGLFGVAHTGVALLKDLLPTRTLSAILPRKIHDRVFINAITQFGTKYYLLMSFVLIIAGSIGYPVGIALFFPHLLPSIPIFYLLLITIPIFAFSKIANILLVAYRRQRYITYQSLFENIAGVVIMITLAPFFGAVGIVLAEVLSYFITTVVKYTYLTRKNIISRFRFRELISISTFDKYQFRNIYNHLTEFTRR